MAVLKLSRWERKSCVSEEKATEIGKSSDTGRESLGGRSLVGAVGGG